MRITRPRARTGTAAARRTPLTAAAVTVVAPVIRAIVAVTVTIVAFAFAFAVIAVTFTVAFAVISVTFARIGTRTVIALTGKHWGGNKQSKNKNKDVFHD